MDYTLIPSLEHIVFVNIVVSLWNQKDIRCKIDWFPFFTSDKLNKWREVENAVTEKVSRLSLPKNLRRCALGYVKPIGKQIFAWLESHKTIYLGILRLPNELCWTTQGLLDSKRTAEALIQDKNLHMITRYKLACTYCLQNDILQVWNEFPENIKNLFNKRAYLREFGEFELVISLFTRVVQGGSLITFFNEIDWFWRTDYMALWHIPRTAPFQFAFEFSAHVCNIAAMEFFLQKLTPREKEESLTRCTEHVAKVHPFNALEIKHCNVLSFLISQMGEEQQLQVYERYPRTMLKCLLDWPWQTLFVEAANRVWDFLSVEDYDDLLNKIILKVKDGFQDWNYRKLFGTFWQKGASPHKRYVLDKCICSDLLTNLFTIEDIENLSLLVRDATVEEKEEMVYYRPDLVLFLIYKDEWILLKLLVEHCLSSRDLVDTFQREYLELDLTSLANKDIVEERAILKKFLKSLRKLTRLPHYKGLREVNWAKEERRFVAWKRLKIRRNNEQLSIKSNVYPNEHIYDPLIYVTRIIDTVI